MATEAPSRTPKPMKNKKKTNPLGARKNQKKSKRASRRNPNLVPLGHNKVLAEKKRKQKEAEDEEKKRDDAGYLISTVPAAQQLRYFLDRFQSANKIKLSPLELEAYRETCMVELIEGREQDAENFGENIKSAFGALWKAVLTEGNLDAEIDAGSPALLVISSSALRSLELLRGLRTLTRECRPAKLFAKHMKLEDQAALLKGRVNIACGTPSRIKKLIDIDALSLSRLNVVMLDMQRDVKGYSLFTLPQVSAEFWDLYKSHLQPKLLQGDTRICFYGAVPNVEKKRTLKSDKNIEE